MQYLTPDSCLFIASELGLRVLHLESLGFTALAGIEKPLSVSRHKTIAHSIKKLIKSIPGFSSVNKIRHKLSSSEQDERIGAYHLFSIMQKTS